MDNLTSRESPQLERERTQASYYTYQMINKCLYHLRDLHMGLHRANVELSGHVALAHAVAHVGSVPPRVKSGVRCNQISTALP